MLLSMIIVCPSCQARYKFDQSKLGDRPRAKTRCAKCGSAIEIENPHIAAMTLPPPPAEAPPPEEQTKKTKTLEGLRDAGAAVATGRDFQKAALELPKDKRYSLAVIQGASTGQIFPLSKARTTLGRSGADINLDDAEASRQHAVVEILGEHAILRDLGSTNGTFVDNQRVEQQVLANQTEFRIGEHVLMFIVTAVE
jgi:predicted Zn finger-like uncharacterized protein